MKYFLLNRLSKALDLLLEGLIRRRLDLGTTIAFILGLRGLGGENDSTFSNKSLENLIWGWENSFGVFVKDHVMICV